MKAVRRPFEISAHRAPGNAPRAAAGQAAVSATLDPMITIAAVQAALSRDGLTDPIRVVLLEQQADLRSAATARTVPPRLKIMRELSGNR
jgi:hypothetical protein